MGESIEDILAKEEKNWKDSKVENNSANNNYPDGVYQVEISNAKLTTSKNLKPMLIFELLVLEGRLKDKKINSYNMLTGQGLGYTKQKIELLEVACNGIKGLIPLVKGGEFIGIMLQVKLSTKDGNQNIYFQKLIKENTPVDSEDLVPPEEDDEEDDIPWSK